MIPNFTLTDFLGNKSNPSYSFTTSGTKERLDFFDDHLICTAGGYSSSTHFSRGKRKGGFSISLKEEFWLKAVMELPVNFYDQAQASFRPMATWNPIQKWRLGLWIDSQKFPRLQNENPGGHVEKLWQGSTRLPVGKHVYALHIIPDVSDWKALTELYVDGELWASVAKANVPSGISTPNIIELTYGIDGAADQDTRSMSLTLWEMACLSDFNPDPCAEARDTVAKTKAAYEAALLALENCESR